MTRHFDSTFDPRRRLVLGAAAALAGCALSPSLNRATLATPFKSDPFTLGVASGYPLPEGVVLWTRLAPESADDVTRLEAANARVEWRIAEDEAMTRVVARGHEMATPDDAHSVHVEVKGLRPGRDYWYRFESGGAASPVGRTRTAPAGDAANARLRLGFCSCAQYEQGYYTAYRDMTTQDLDAVVHLGDYIYESSWGQRHVRKHTGAVPTTLPEFRDRYALYKSDADLKAAHAALPWLVTWDDHEVANDYANDISPVTRDPAHFLAMRAAAYRAWYEHMPVPPAMRPRGPDARIYGRWNFGSLCELVLLDNRQYRSHHACLPGPSTSTMVDCPERLAPERSMLGMTQERFLAERMQRAPAQWSVVAQATLVAEVDRKPGAEHGYWMDGWDGYAASRARMIDALATHPSRNAIVVGGDVHAFYAADLRRDFSDRNAPPVATEFVGGAITSQGASPTTIANLLAKNPQLRFGRADKRGYGIVTLERAGSNIEFRIVDDEKVAGSPVRTMARFTVENGRPGVVSP